MSPSPRAREIRQGLRIGVRQPRHNNRSSNASGQQQKKDGARQQPIASPACLARKSVCVPAALPRALLLCPTPPLRDRHGWTAASAHSSEGRRARHHRGRSLSPRDDSGSVREAYEAAKESARAHTELGKKLTVEVRRLERAADNFFQEAKEQKKRAKRFYRQLHWYTANPVVNVKRAESDEKNGE